MRFDKSGGKAFWIGIQQIGHITLLPKLYLLGLMIGDMGIAHANERIAQFLRIGAGEFDKFEAVGSGRVFSRDY